MDENKNKLAVSPAASQFTLKAQSDRNAPSLSDYHLESLIHSGRLDLAEMQKEKMLVRSWKES